MENKIYKLSDEEFGELISSSLNISEVLFKLGYTVKGNSWAYGLVRRRVLELGCVFKGKTAKQINHPPVNINKLFCEHSKHSRSVARRYIIQHKLLPYKCSCCGINKWNGKTLSLELDHINGIADDNRLENLRLLCPNCHSQTTTYGALNKSTSNCIYDISDELEELVLKSYCELNNIKKVSKKYNLQYKIVRYILSKNNMLKPNQKYVIQYDGSDEINRFGSISECCKFLMDNDFVHTKKMNTCRRILHYNNNKLWNGYCFKIIGCLEDNK